MKTKRNTRRERLLRVLDKLEREAQHAKPWNRTELLASIQKIKDRLHMSE